MRAGWPRASLAPREDHDADRRQNALVEVLTTGDTDGIDKDKTGMEMLFKPQTVILRQDTDCVSANALIRADANRQLSPAAAALLQQKLNTLSPALRGDLERLPRAPGSRTRELRRYISDLVPSPNPRAAAASARG